MPRVAFIRLPVKRFDMTKQGDEYYISESFAIHELTLPLLSYQSYNGKLLYITAVPPYARFLYFDFMRSICSLQQSSIVTRARVTLRCVDTRSTMVNTCPLHLARPSAI